MIRQFIIGVFAAALFCSANADETKWSKLLDSPLDDEWQQIMGIGLEQSLERPAETLAAKIAAIQNLILEETGEFLPIFVPPSFGVLEMKMIPASEELRTGLPLTKVPALEAFRYIASSHQHEIVVTDVGLIFRSLQSRAD